MTTEEVVIDSVYMFDNNTTDPIHVTVMYYIESEVCIIYSVIFE